MSEEEAIEDIDSLQRRIDFMLHKSDEMVFELNEYMGDIREAQAEFSWLVEAGKSDEGAD